MTTYEQLPLAISFASNTPGMPTGYGQQGHQVITRMLRHGMKVAALSNYGLEGAKSELQVGNKKIPHYPRGLTAYGTDVMPIWAKDFADQHPKLKHYLMTLYDVWVYNDLQYDDPILSWVPMDHLTIPPGVHKFISRPNVTPIAMAPHGKRLMDAQGIESVYIPHGIDTKVYKPTFEIENTPVRQYMGVPEDAFLVGMVAANKANGVIHRKAFAENLLAFAIHLKQYPDSYLYIHTEPSKAYGGFDLTMLLKVMGIPKENVLMPDRYLLRTGYPDKHMAAFYTAMDALLSTSYGEGFGVPTVEAQACGTRVITSNFAASADLAGSGSWLVGGQPLWDESQGSFFQIPNVNEIVKALELAYNAERGVNEESIKFAKQFDADRVWVEHWLPFLKGLK